MTEAGADIVVAHMGLHDRRRDRREAAVKTLDGCVPLTIVDACRGACGADVHRALPRRSDRDAGRRRLPHQRVAGLHGFYGASSMERLPTEIAITEQTRKFKALSF